MNLNKIKYFLIISIFLLTINNSVFASNPFNYDISTVFIDAGHGGSDPGANRKWDFEDSLIMEKDITLKLSKKVENYLNDYNLGIEIIQTREDDRYLSLQDRSQICFTKGLRPKTSSLFVSIHVNAASSKNANGYEIYTKLKSKNVPLFDENTPIENIPFFSVDNLTNLNQFMFEKSDYFANNVLNEIEKAYPLKKNRGVKQEDLYVLNVCRTSAILIEVGFLSNEKEARELVDNSYLEKMAKAIAKGIKNTIL